MAKQNKCSNIEWFEKKSRLLIFDHGFKLIFRIEFSSHSLSLPISLFLSLSLLTTQRIAQFQSSLFHITILITHSAVSPIYKWPIRPFNSSNKFIALIKVNRIEMLTSRAKMKWFLIGLTDSNKSYNLDASFFHSFTCCKQTFCYLFWLISHFIVFLGSHQAIESELSQGSISILLGCDVVVVAFSFELCEYFMACRRLNDEKCVLFKQ